MSTEQSPATIAIDGPAASGKTTIGQMLAAHLRYMCLDTGSMYRAATLAALVNGVSLDDEAAVVALTQNLQMRILPAESEIDGRFYTVLLNGRDVTWELRSSYVDDNVSQVSAYQGVREDLVRRQREIARTGKVVMVGRDIGTVVLPNAPLKLYITASPEERARRRWQERRTRDPTIHYEGILADIIRRDGIDGSRIHSPMRPADDAIVIDTTGRTPEEILREILNMEQFRRQDPDRRAIK